MGRPSAALHARCLASWQAQQSPMWRSAPLNRIAGWIWLNLTIAAVLAVASIGIPWERLITIWPLWAVINGGLLVVRGVLWWTIERHVPR